MKNKIYRTVLLLSVILFAGISNISGIPNSLEKTITVFASSASIGENKLTKSDIQKVLSLKMKDYQDLTLKEFSDYLSDMYEKNNSIWKARQRFAYFSDAHKKAMKLSENDYRFLTITIPCTEAESTYERDRVGQIPPDFSGRFDLYSKSLRTMCHFEYCVQYSADFEKITVGERDAVILKVKKGMENFVKKSAVDPAKKEFEQQINKKLDALIEKNTNSKIELKVYQYPGK